MTNLDGINNPFNINDGLRLCRIFITLITTKIVCEIIMCITSTYFCFNR